MSEARSFAEPLNAGIRGALGLLLRRLARAIFYGGPSLTAGQVEAR